MSKDVKTGEENTGKACGWETGEDEFKKTKYPSKKEGIRIQGMRRGFPLVKLFLVQASRQ